LVRLQLTCYHLEDKVDKRGQDWPTPPHDGLEGEDHPHEMHARRVPHLRSPALTVAHLQYSTVPHLQYSTVPHLQYSTSTPSAQRSTHCGRCSGLAADAPPRCVRPAVHGTHAMQRTTPTSIHRYDIGAQGARSAVGLTPAGPTPSATGQQRLICASLACNTRHATRNMRHATCDMRHATCNMRHATDSSSDD
jgi:hypothetical protein